MCDLINQFNCVHNVVVIVLIDTAANEPLNVQFLCCKVSGNIMKDVHWPY